MSETENTAGAQLYRSGFVYFIKPVEMDGPIKIGFTKNLDQRFAAIQACSPVKLEIVGYFAATEEHERVLHRMFWEERSHCEWFRAVPELQAVAAAYADALDGDVAEVTFGDFGQEWRITITRSFDRERELAKQNVKAKAQLPKPPRVGRQRPFRACKRRGRSDR